MRPSTRLTRTDNLVPYTTLVRSGTVLLVSHDREFLNNVVTQTLAAEEGGHWREYVWGYDEWLEQRPAPIDEGPLTKPRKRTEEHKSQLHSIKRTSYAGFCLKKKIKTHNFYK